MTDPTGRMPKVSIDFKQLTPSTNGIQTGPVHYILMELDHREGGNVTVQGRIRVGAAARDGSRAQPPRVGAAAKDESWAQPPKIDSSGGFYMVLCSLCICKQLG